MWSPPLLHPLDETDIIENLVPLAEELNLQKHRSRTVLNRKNRELELLRRDRQHLYNEMDELVKNYENLSVTNTAINELIQSSSTESAVLPTGTLLSAQSLRMERLH